MYLGLESSPLQSTIQSSDAMQRVLTTTKTPGTDLQSTSIFGLDSAIPPARSLLPTVGPWQILVPTLMIRTGLAAGHVDHSQTLVPSWYCSTV